MTENQIVGIGEIVEVSSLPSKKSVKVAPFSTVPRYDREELRKGIKEVKLEKYIKQYEKKGLIPTKKSILRDKKVKNKKANETTPTFAYTQENEDFSFLVGTVVRDDNMMLLGTVREIEQGTDGYGHMNAVAIVDSVYDTVLRISCRNLVTEGMPLKKKMQKVENDIEMAELKSKFNITKGTVFSTEFEDDCVADGSPDQDGNFDGWDSSNQLCQYSLEMVTETSGKVEWDD